MSFDMNRCTVCFQQYVVPSLARYCEGKHREKKDMALYFGWCLDGNHDRCKASFIDWNNVEKVCTCECHKNKE